MYHAGRRSARGFIDHSRAHVADMNETDRTEHALSVAERIEQEFMARLTTFMRASVPLEEMDRVQAEHDLRNGIIRPARRPAPAFAPRERRAA